MTKKIESGNIKGIKNSEILGVLGTIILKQISKYYRVMYTELHRLWMEASGGS
jgi:hypothetical protein